ncbi:hypothetical protein DBV05_g5199 [Lasiodiplodia theobromae]|uniref:Uncharacterized protein n=2 Tax=Lasiodiplodia theobromae TaxID=45133 RepID=A0A5N5DE48_9PEZI|nr:hypothetical protein DBV05_g5199 [Lasiodiplodia theobromae]
MHYNSSIARRDLSPTPSTASNASSSGSISPPRVPRRIEPQLLHSHYISRSREPHGHQIPCSSCEMEVDGEDECAEGEHPSFTNPSVPLPLTIGIEIEALFVYNVKAMEADVEAMEARYGKAKPPSYSSWLLVVAHALREAGVDVNVPGDGNEAPQYTRWGVSWDWSVDDMRGLEEGGCHLDLVMDPSEDQDFGGMGPTKVDSSWADSESIKQLKREGEYAFVGLELQSPKYLWSSGDCWRDDVRHTLDALHRLFNNRSNDRYRLYTPESTSLHVHVGVGTQSERYTLPLSSIKSFIQLVTGFERLTDELHAIPRLDSRAVYCWPMSRVIDSRAEYERYEKSKRFLNFDDDGDDEVSMSNSPPGRGTVESWCQNVEQEVQEWEDLVRLKFKARRGQAYNLRELKISEGKLDENCKGTIEFRQHRGTLDADEAIAWVEVATSMIRFAHNTALTGNMLSLVQQYSGHPKMGFDAFMYLIGVSDKTIGYYTMWLDVDANFDRDGCEESGIHSRRVEGWEKTEMLGSRLNDMTDFFAGRREQQKNPEEVMQAIVLRLKSGDYGLPEEVVSQLLQEKYPGVGGAFPHHQWERSTGRW